jgi:hypothetical protein
MKKGQILNHSTLHILIVTYKAYLDNIQVQTGKTPEDFRKLAKEKNLVKYSELLKWLKTECGLGHGHANAMILYIQNPELAKKKIQEDIKEQNAKKKSKKVISKLSDI